MFKPSKEHTERAKMLARARRRILAQRTNLERTRAQLFRVERDVKLARELASGVARDRVLKSAVVECADHLVTDFLEKIVGKVKVALQERVENGDLMVTIKVPETVYHQIVPRDLREIPGPGEAHGVLQHELQDALEGWPALPGVQRHG